MNSSLYPETSAFPAGPPCREGSLKNLFYNVLAAGGRMPAAGALPRIPPKRPFRGDHLARERKRTQEHRFCASQRQGAGRPESIIPPGPPATGDILLSRWRGHKNIIPVPREDQEPITPPTAPPTKKSFSLPKIGAQEIVPHP